VLRYVFDSREYRYTIGPFPSLSVEAARREAKRLRATIDIGQTHPMAEREKKRGEARARREAETFADAVDDYIIREQIGRRKNATANQVKRGLTTDCAAWKDRPVAEIKAADIRKLLETIRDGGKDTQPRPYLANRTYAYLKTFFAWCAEPGIEKIPLSPMIGLRRPWEGEEARQRWFTDDELKALWAAGDELGGVAGAYLKMAMLTGKRRSALASMQWDHIDDAGVWSPPSDGQRRKRNKRLHGDPPAAACPRVLAGIRPRGCIDGLRLRRQSQGDGFTPAARSSAASARFRGIEDFFCMPAATRWRRAWPSCASRRTSAT
jgi:integrase